MAPEGASGFGPLKIRHGVTDVNVSWVEGYANRVDILRGRTMEEDEIGNDTADALAVAGAALHQIPAEVLLAAHERKEHAKSTHSMMLAILKARLAAENGGNNSEDLDRGSHMGSCINSLDDDVDQGVGILRGVH